MSKWKSGIDSSVDGLGGVSSDPVPHIVDPMDEEDYSEVLKKLVIKLKDNYNAEKFFVDVGETIVAMKEQDKVFRSKAMSSKRESSIKQAINIWKQRFEHIVLGSNEDIPQLLSTPKSHPFSKVHEALEALKQTKRSQVIVTKGISGSGKSEIAEMMINQIVQLGDPEGILEEKTNAAMRVLNAFGNAQTVSNTNSTRMAKFVSVYFDQGIRATHVTFDTCLLEKSRIVCVPFEERNFHIFHMLCEAIGKVDNGTWKPLADKFGIVSDGSQFHYLLPEKFERMTKPPSSWKAKEELQKTIDAFILLGFTKSEVESIFQILIIILYLGNIKMKQNKTTEGCTVDPKNEETDIALTYLSKLIQISREELEETLTFGFTLAAKGEKVKTTIRRQLAVYSLDAFSKGLYEMLIMWIMNRMNSALSPPGASNGSIGSVSVLDMFGFQRSFHVNGFETLMTNYANEAIQGEFLNRSLFANMAHCFDEGFTPPGSDLKKNQHVAHLFNKKKNGILKILNNSTVFDPSETKFREYSMIDQRFLDSVKKHIDSDYLKPIPSRPDCFLIKHFLGSVLYSGRGMVARNHDIVNTHIMMKLHTSSGTFTLLRALIDGAAEILTVHEPESNHKSYVVTYRKAQTISKSTGKLMLDDDDLKRMDDEVGDGMERRDSEQLNVDLIPSAQQKKLKKTIAMQFEEQLQSKVIGKWLEDKGLLFISCVSPFAVGSAEFETTYLAPQLENSGICAVQEIEDKLYPESYTIEEFVESFKYLVDDVSEDPAKAFQQIVKHIDGAVDQERSYKRYTVKFNIVRIRGSLLKKLAELRGNQRPLAPKPKLALDSAKPNADHEKGKVKPASQLTKQVSFGQSEQIEKQSFPPVDALVTKTDAKNMIEDVLKNIKVYIKETVPPPAPPQEPIWTNADVTELKSVLGSILTQLQGPPREHSLSHHFYYQVDNQTNELERPNQVDPFQLEEAKFEEKDEVCCALVMCQDGCGSRYKRLGRGRKGTCFALVCCDSVGKSLKEKRKGYRCYSVNYFFNPFYVCQLWRKNKDE